jgi:hypothetical protein
MIFLAARNAKKMETLGAASRFVQNPICFCERSRVYVCEIFKKFLTKNKFLTPKKSKNGRNMTKNDRKNDRKVFNTKITDNLQNNFGRNGPNSVIQGAFRLKKCRQMAVNWRRYETKNSVFKRITEL